MKAVMITLLKITGTLILTLILFALYWFLRPNSSRVAKSIIRNVNEIKTDTPHNAFTDMVSWQGNMYLTFRTATDHESPESAAICIMKSADGTSWKKLTTFKRKGKDIRDPKFAVIKNRLFLYVVSADRIDDPTTTTFFTYTDDGVSWNTLTPLIPKFKRLWRAKTRDNKTWYCPIFRDFRVDLYSTTNGINWQHVSNIHNTEGADETAFDFLPDGRIIVSMRLQSESLIGDNNRGTLITTSSYPYKKWSKTKSDLNRLDGPCLVKTDGGILAIGRYQPEVDNLLQQKGSIFTRKRTSLFLLTEKNLYHISDLPSAGDTSYPSFVYHKGKALVSFYTSNPKKDNPWVYGFFRKTKVYIAELDASRLKSRMKNLASSEEEKKNYRTTLPWRDYGAFFLSLLVSMAAFFKIKISKKA